MANITDCKTLSPDAPLVTSDQLDDLTPEQRATAEAEALTIGTSDRVHPELVEKAAERRELNTNDPRIQASKLDHQAEVESYRPGRVLSQNEFLYLLRKIRPDARYNEYSASGMVGLNVIQHGCLQYVCGVQCGAMPEWEQVRTDAYHVATTSSYRGFRTVLLRMILAGLITEEQVDRVFGRPEGRFAERYLRQLQEFRLHNLGLD